MPAKNATELVFSKKCYNARRGEVQLHMSHFFLRYLHDIYEAFSGDLALAIVLGEISHHNTAKFFSPEQATNEPLRGLQENPARWTHMDGCNAYSISCATGIPRETVRRKVSQLKKRGWVEGSPRRGLHITKGCEDHFGPDYSLRFLNGLLRASRNIEALLLDHEMEDRPAGKAGSAPLEPGPSTRKSSREARLPSKPKRQNQ